MGRRDDVLIDELSHSLSTASAPRLAMEPGMPAGVACMPICTPDPDEPQPSEPAAPRRRNALSNFFITLGTLLLAASIALIAYNLWDGARASGASNAALSSLLAGVIGEQGPADKDLADKGGPNKHANTANGVVLLSTALDPTAEMPEEEVDGIAYVAVLSIPELGIELPVASTWDYDLLKVTPCRYWGTAYARNMVVCAHNYTRHFGGLVDLSPGAEVLLMDMDGNILTYEVVEVDVLAPTEVEHMITPDGWDLTLFTCTLGGATRVTVRCSLTC